MASLRLAEAGNRPSNGTENRPIAATSPDRHVRIARRRRRDTGASGSRRAKEPPVRPVSPNGIDHGRRVLLHADRPGAHHDSGGPISAAGPSMAARRDSHQAIPMCSFPGRRRTHPASPPYRSPGRRPLYGPHGTPARTGTRRPPGATCKSGIRLPAQCTCRQVATLRTTMRKWCQKRYRIRELR